MDTILSRLGSFAVSRARHGPHSSIGELVAAGARAFILYDSSWTPDAHEFLFPPSAIDSPWLNKPLPDQLLAAAQRAWLEPEPRAPGTFFVYQGICTPDLDTIIHSTFPPRGPFRSLEQLARLVTAEVTAWLAAVPPRGIAPGICIADFFEDPPAPVRSVPAPSRFVRTVVLRNYADIGAVPARVPLMQRVITVSSHFSADESGLADVTSTPALTPRVSEGEDTGGLSLGVFAHAEARITGAVPITADVALQAGFGGVIASVIRDYPDRFFGGAIVGATGGPGLGGAGEHTLLISASVVVAGAVDQR